MTRIGSPPRGLSVMRGSVRTSWPGIDSRRQRRAAVAFVHPSVLPGLEPIGGIPPFIADFLLGTTRAAINLARSGTLDRCPDVTVILSHAGGFIPYAAHRVAVAASGKGDEECRMVDRPSLPPTVIGFEPSCGSRSLLCCICLTSAAVMSSMLARWPFVPEAPPRSTP